MDFIWNKITEWLKEIMIGGIMGNLQGLFDNVNQQVSGIAGQVCATPQAWNSSIYRMIRSLSDNVILPIGVPARLDTASERSVPPESGVCESGAPHPSGSSGN